MLINIVYFFLVFAIISLSQDQWLCVVSSSQLQGDKIAACGVGEGLSEGLARMDAFESAKAEFNSICGPDTACGMHKYAVEPKRTSCERIPGGWKCYRLLVFSVIEAPRREIASAGIIPSKSVGNLDLSNGDLLNRIIYLRLGGR